MSSAELPIAEGSSSSQQVVRIAINLLQPGPPVRSGGLDEDHATLLATVPDQLPPILVHDESLVVVDGMHRVRAAVLRGESHIDARLMSGDKHEIFAAAVKANVAHGKPLTTREREAAALYMLKGAPHLSDRLIGAACALSHSTVAKLRRSSGQNVQSTLRQGRDGRKRGPVASRGPEHSRHARDAREDARLSLGTPSNRHMPTRPTIEPDRRVLRTDRAFYERPDLLRFADWFDCHGLLAPIDKLPLRALPGQRIRDIIAESERRATYWHDFARQLECSFNGRAEAMQSPTSSERANQSYSVTSEELPCP